MVKSHRYNIHHGLVIVYCTVVKIVIFAQCRRMLYYIEAIKPQSIITYPLGYGVI